MNYGGTLLVVKDLDRSKRFYREVLGQEVILDFGANVTLTGGFSLQTLDTWTGFIGKREREILFGANAGELYFEEEDFDGFLQRLQGMDGVDYVHPVAEHGWGQRGIRIYDPDKHIIEIGEDMRSVVRRFSRKGLTPEEISVRMDVPLEYVISQLA